ncbi:MAG: hypothetical protein FJ144_05135 [Deltaproteobacteria bacterium]|nr:hypothetical protein [Deltaproteobacteria bacterium]
MARGGESKNPADRVFHTRLRETIHFPDLSERRALKLTALPRYTARAHFGLWMRRHRNLDGADPERTFTPLVHVDLQASDVPLDPAERIHVHGKTFLARTVDESGATRNLAREGHYTVLRKDGEVVARVRLVNFFTRNDPSPEHRRVTRLPEALGLGEGPSRATEVPSVDDLIPLDRAPDLAESSDRVWHYGQTDPNRHVNAVEYLRTIEEHVGTSLASVGHDLSRVWVRRARIVYRKPCFRGETYRRIAWMIGEAPPRIGAAIRKGNDAPGAKPAVAVELTLDQHDRTEGDAR